MPLSFQFRSFEKKELSHYRCELSMPRTIQFFPRMTSATAATYVAWPGLVWSAWDSVCDDNRTPFERPRWTPRHPSGGQAQRSSVPSPALPNGCADVSGLFRSSTEVKILAACCQLKEREKDGPKERICVFTTASQPSTIQSGPGRAKKNTKTNGIQ